MAARWALGLLACAWTGGAMLLPLDCDADLRISYDQITYYNSVVNCGNLFLKSDIAIEPTVRFPRANPNKTYTLLYISTESDTNPPRSWPDVVSDGLVHLHWIVGDVTPGMLLGEGNVSAATKIHGDDWPRHGPSPTQP
ncbi:hypothetical protein M885DRAFT_539595 [Pelagophyceae sp. CCMP2097]|nr:hypothetical protein M885DRAFT_539595 [Pelagophyceae sp. CCMP2097]